MWGAFDGSEFIVFERTDCLAEWAAEQRALLYAHNGGKFDFIFLMPWIKQTKVKIINSRVVEMRIGNSTLRDSWSIIPIALRDYQKTEIDYAKLEKKCRAKHMMEITAYLRDDCVNLFDLVTTYRSAAGKGLTIAGNALAFAKKNCEIGVFKTNAKFDETFRRFYFGGRCEAFKPGKHFNVKILDIKSAYPYAMVHDHAHTSDFTERLNHFAIGENRLKQCFIILTCFSHGAFPIRTREGLAFPIGEGTYYVTGWELVTALKHKLIGNVQVHKCYEFYDEINFTTFVNHWFEHKQKADKEGDKANRIIGKIMLNSLYGKFAQNPVKYRDYEIHPAGTKPSEGWDLELELGENEIHSRPTLWRLQKEYGDAWKTFPVFYNVATAASITGFCRAMLLDCFHTIGIDNILYTDTDSVFVAKAGFKNISNLRTDDKLGSWGLEGIARECYIAGRKLYACKGDFKAGEKIASKGAVLGFNEIRRIVEDGETIEWKNPAPTFALDGTAKFVVRKVRATGLRK